MLIPHHAHAHVHVKTTFKIIYLLELQIRKRKLSKSIGDKEVTFTAKSIGLDKLLLRRTIRLNSQSD